MTLEQLTFILSAVNSTLLALFLLYLKFGIEKRLKKYEYFLGDASELNNKMHDRLVEVEELIANLNPIPKSIQKRLLMNASRLKKHDPSIPQDVEKLITVWNEGFLLDEKSAGVNLVGLEERKVECSKLVEKIKGKVDKLVK